MIGIFYNQEKATFLAEREYDSSKRSLLFGMFLQFIYLDWMIFIGIKVGNKVKSPVLYGNIEIFWHKFVRDSFLPAGNSFRYLFVTYLHHSSYY